MRSNNLKLHGIGHLKGIFGSVWDYHARERGIAWAMSENTGLPSQALGGR